MEIVFPMAALGRCYMASLPLDKPQHSRVNRVFIHLMRKLINSPRKNHVKILNSNWVCMLVLNTP